MEYSFGSDFSIIEATAKGLEFFWDCKIGRLPL